MKAILIIAIVLQGCGIMMKLLGIFSGIATRKKSNPDRDDYLVQGMGAYGLFGILPAAFFEFIFIYLLITL